MRRCSLAYTMPALVGSVRIASNSSINMSGSAVLQSSSTEGRRAFSSYTTALHARRMVGRGGRHRTRHREATEGDWVCQCGEVNYKSKRECYKCGAPAPPLPPGVRRPSLPGEDPHDWACPCGQMNFRGNVTCHRCASPKPQPPPMPGKEVTLWTCSKCKGINRNNRKFCFKCSAPSPLLAFKPIE